MDPSSIANFDPSFVQWKTLQHLPDIDPQTQHLKVNQIKSHSPLAEKIKYLQDNFDTINLIKMRLFHLLGVMQIITLYKKDKLSFLKNESWCNVKIHF